MKKTVLWIALLVICTCLILVACDGNEQGNDPADTDAQTATPSETEQATEPVTEEAHVHHYDEWEILTQASCTGKGEKIRYCSCGEKQTGEVAATGHAEKIDAAVAPTCTETGLTEGKHCSVCGEVLEAQEIIPAFGKHSGTQRCDGCGLDYFEELAGIIVRNGSRNEYGTMVYQYYSNSSVNVTFYYTSSGEIEVGVMLNSSEGTYNFYLKMSDASGDYRYSSLAWLSSSYVMYDIEGILSASSNSKEKTSLQVVSSSKEHYLSGSVSNLTSSEVASCTDTDRTAMKLVLQKMDELLKKQSDIDITHFGFH